MGGRGGGVDGPRVYGRTPPPQSNRNHPRHVYNLTPAGGVAATFIQITAWYCSTLLSDDLFFFFFQRRRGRKSAVGSSFPPLSLMKQTEPQSARRVARLRASNVSPNTAQGRQTDVRGREESRLFGSFPGFYISYCLFFFFLENLLISEDT